MEFFKTDNDFVKIAILKLPSFNAFKIKTHVAF